MRTQFHFETYKFKVSLKRWQTSFVGAISEFAYTYNSPSNSIPWWAWLFEEGAWGSRTQRAITTLGTTLFPRPVALSQQAVNSGGLTSGPREQVH